MERLLVIDNQRDPIEEITSRVKRLTRVLQYLGPRLMVVEGSTHAIDELVGSPGIYGVYAGPVLDLNDAVLVDLSRSEQLGLRAWNVRHSNEYHAEKKRRPGDGESWADSSDRIC